MAIIFEIEHTTTYKYANAVSLASIAPCSYQGPPHADAS